MKKEEILAVFPLPNVVFFPGINLPLHIFEPRYCEMIRETMVNKQHIGMFLLQPGWEQDYYGNPPVFPVGCSGELTLVEELPDDKFNVVLKGLYRVRALEETQENPYRKARVEILPEIVRQDAGDLQAVRAELLLQYRRITNENSALDALTDFTVFVNSLAGSLRLDLESRLQLLTEDDVLARARILGGILQKQAAIVDWASRFGHLRPVDPGVN